MKTNRNRAIKIAAGLGVIAGMRSMTAPAALSHHLSHHPANGLGHSKFRFLRSPIFSTASKLLAAGEMIGDKAPQMPDRIKPASLAVRAASGGMVGAAVFKYHTQKVWQGAVIGGAAAVASTFLSFYLRKRVGRQLNLTDKAVGVVEDVIAASSGAAIMNKS